MSSGYPGRRRVRQDGGRKNKFTVRLSDQELEVIGRRAFEAGVSVQWFLVDAALEPKYTLAERRALVGELLSTRRLAGRVSNNLNQLARIANGTGQVPPELAAALAATARAMSRLDEVAERIRQDGQAGSAR